MSDPAVEAAQRAEAVGWIHRQHVEAGAREMAKPIRELHAPSRPADPRWRYCTECGIDSEWPCDTAKLIYSTEELSDDRS